MELIQCKQAFMKQNIQEKLNQYTRLLAIFCIEKLHIDGI
jgi:hypothetical protein